VSLAGRAVKVTPFKGPYIPKVGDKIIGRVIDITMTGWRVDTYTAYSAVLNVRDATTRFIRKNEDLSKIFSIGDFIVAQIITVTSQNLIDISMKGPGFVKAEGGRIIRVNPLKVPRIIGKQGSMISLIKKETNCQITVGQNGVVWIKGQPDDELRAENAIKRIEEKAHEEGLTEHIEKFLQEGKK
jgi:exosome complex component RRP4